MPGLLLCSWRVNRLDFACGGPAEKLRSSSRRLLERRAGGLPLPILLILIVLLGCLGLFPATSGGLAMALVLLPVAAICAAAIGERFAALRGLGIDTIIALVLPSYLAHLGWIRPGVLQDIRDVFERADVLGWIIAVLVFGGVLSIDRTALARTAAGIVVPVVVASLAAAGVGIAAGALLGEDPVETFFFVVAPIMGGGIGAGAIPLSAGYADNLGRSGGEFWERHCLPSSSAISRRSFWPGFLPVAMETTLGPTLPPPLHRGPSRRAICRRPRRAERPCSPAPRPSSACISPPRRRPACSIFRRRSR